MIKNKLKWNISNFRLILAVFAVSVSLGVLGLATEVRADNFTEGIVLSTDLLSGVSDEAWITGFTATTSVPASTTVGFLFSVDGDKWYNSRGEEGNWDTVASGTTSFNLESLQWATSTLATTSLEFYYKVRLTTNIATATPIVYAVAVEYSDTYDYDPADNGWYEEGIVLSTDLLSGVSDEAWITGFTATTSVPASTTVGFLFSVDGDKWYDHEGVEGRWDTVASGTTSFNLEALQWATSTLATTSLEFYYKVRLTSNIATHTPVIYDVSLEYSDVYDYDPADNGWFEEGIYVSNILIDQPADEVQYFGYNLSSLPASTTAQIMFSNDGVNYYSSTGTAWYWEDLAVGDHLASSSGFDLTGRGWTEDLYYKIKLTSNIATHTPVVSEVKAYFTERDPVEFTAVVDPDQGDGYSFDSLSGWEAAVQSDLTATTTRVYSYATSTAVGVFPNGSTVVGATSGATGTLVHLTGSSTSASAQLLISNITNGLFQKGERVYVEGSPANYVYLTTSGDYAIAVAKCRSTGGSADTAAVVISGWTTDADNYIKIWTDPDEGYRHQGKWDDDKYRLSVDQTSAQPILDIGSVDYVQIEGLQVEQTSSVGNNIVSGIGTSGSTLTASDNLLTISDCIVRQKHVYSADRWSCYGLILDSSNLVTHVYNNVITGWNDGGIFTDDGSTALIFNNTVYNSTTDPNDGGSGGIRRPDTIATYAINNIVFDNSDDFNGTMTLLNNASDDGDGTGAVTPGDWDDVFVDYANNDMHLKSSDTDCKDAGYDLWFTSPLSIQTDIDGSARGASIDIGADEVNTEFVSTICESTTSGGACATDLDYTYLSQWEDAVEADLTATSTRVFGGSITGSLSENDSLDVYDCSGTCSDTSMNVTVVATTSDQILLDGITGTTSPLIMASGTQFRLSGGTTNMWTITGTNDDLGASPIAIAKIDGSWTATDTANVFISTQTADHDNYFKIYTTDEARHNGDWSYTDYRLVPSSNEPMIIGDVDFVWLDGLQIENVENTEAISVDQSAANPNSMIKISNNIIRGNLSADNLSFGIQTRDVRVSIWNNIVYDYVYGSSNHSGINVNTSTGDPYSYVFNNTVFNARRAFNIEAQVLAYNNIAQDNDGYGFSGTAVGDYNISEDASAPGSNSQTVTTVDFVSTSTGDFHLASTDTAAIDQGLDLSATTTLQFSDDIDGTNRPFNGVWDIGADEYALYTIYRSVGPGSTGALECGGGSRQLSISSSQLTIDTGAGLADNIGVGDAIVYNASSTIVFISGRTSSTTYSIQDADGTAPDTTASGDTGWCIFRAYTSLYNAERGNENDGLPNAVEDFDNWDGTGDYTDTDEVGRDLVANNEKWYIACYGDSGDTISGANPIELNGWTTSANNYLTIYTPYQDSQVGESQRHNGKWDNNKYYIQGTDSGGFGVNLLDPYIRIDGLQIYNTITSQDGDAVRVDVSTETSINYISNNIIRGAKPTTGRHNGIMLRAAGADSIAYVYNNIIYDIGKETDQGSNNDTGVNTNDGDWTVYVYNNTAINLNTGFAKRDNGSTMIFKNNIAQGCNDGFWAEWSFGDSDGNNISDISGDAPGSNSQNGVYVKFWDRVGKDYHIHPEDSYAIDAGTSSVSSIVVEDIDGKPIHTYDIGADDASVYFESTVMESGGDFSSLYDWEAANNVDLTATTTMVFDVSASIGYIPHGASLYGTSSGAVASTTLFATSTNQILLYNIASSTFINGEGVCVDGSTNNCVTLSDAGNYAIGTAKIDGVWSGADTQTVEINGWTTGKYNNIYIYTTPTARHKGRWDDNGYNLYGNPGAQHYGLITIHEGYVEINGLQLSLDTAWSYTAGIYIRPNESDINLTIVKNSIIRQSNIDTYQYGISQPRTASTDSNSSTLHATNNIIYGFNQSSSACFQAWSGEDTAYLYNNTVYNCNIGINAENTTPTIYAINNIAQNCTNGYDDIDEAESDFNISDISGDAPNATFNTGAHSVTFVDAANNDFRLNPTDTTAISSGTPSVYYDTILNISTDIDGTTRGAVPDIGADEVNTEFVSTICQATSTGGSCNELDYKSLFQWEDAVESDIASSATRVFSGYLTGTLSEDDSVTLVYPNYATTTITGTVVATTSDQILIDNITGTSTPLGTASGSTWYLSAGNYWNIGGTGDELGASPIAIAKIDGSWNASDTTSVDLNGWTTDYDNFIKIYTTDEARHDGVWDYDKYRIIETAVPTEGFIAIMEDYITIVGVQAGITNSGDYVSVFDNADNVFSSNNLTIIDKTIIQQFVSGTNNGGYGIYFRDSADTHNFKILNSVISGFGGRGIYLNNVASGEVYNCTIANNIDTAIDNNDLAITYRNLVLFNNGNEDIEDSTNATIDYCASDDDVGTNSIDLASSTAAWDTHFVDWANNNYLLLEDSTLVDAGTSSDTFASELDYDVQGEARPHGNEWDVGADEYALYTIYRSVGPGSTGALECGGGSRQLSISSSQLTIDTGAGLADNIGVGDAIVYNASSSIIFISGRTSSTTYAVQDADGTSPDTSASADTGWCVFRAYTSLYDAERGDENDGLPNAVEDFDNWDGTGDYTDTDEVGRDLVTNNEQWNIACYADAVDNVDGLSNGVHVEDWTTSNSNYLNIYTPHLSSQVGESQRHNGSWNGGGYRIRNNVDGDAEEVIMVQNPNVTIDGLQILSIDNGYANVNGIGSTYPPGTNGDKLIIKNNIIKSSTSSAYGMFIGDSNSVGFNYEVYNNIVYGGFWRGIYLTHTASNYAYVFNNTVIGCQDVAFWASSNPNDYYRNNIAVDTRSGNDYNFVDGAPYSGNNMGNGETPPGSNSIQARPKFWDEVGEDFHLHSEDTSGAIDGGTSTVSSIVTSDIDNKPIHTYDIGADDASVYFESTVMESGGDFSSLYDWEAANNVDLTATTTMVFDVSASIGYIPHGASVYGTSSGAIASTTLFATSTNQILLYNIASSTFEEGEGVCVSGGTTNCVTLSDAGNYAIGTAKIDGVWSNGDINTTGVDLDGWDTGKYNYIYIYTTPTARHKGKWSDNSYYLQRSADAAVLYTQEDHILLEGLQIKTSDTNGQTWNDGIQIDKAPTTGDYYLIVDSCIIQAGLVTSGDGVQAGSSMSNVNLYLFNSVVSGFDGQGVYAINGGDIDSNNMYIYNNTIYGNNEGIDHNYGSVIVVVNNAVFGNNDDFESPANMYLDRNASDDGDGSNPITPSNWDDVFVDYSNGDFHLKSTDTDLRNQGTSTYGFLPYTYHDIDDTTRGAVPDIGADEVNTEFVSTICETSGSGGDCSELDYNTLSQWEDAVEADLTPAGTRVFGGYLTGTLSEDDSVTLVYPNYATTTVTGTVVATTSDQILIDNITGTSTPVWAATNSQWYLSAGNYWNIGGTGDELGASPIAIAKIDGSWNASDTVQLYMSGWEFDHDNYIKIHTTDTARHDGKWDYTAYRTVNDGYDGAIYGYAAGLPEYGTIIIDGLQVDNTDIADGGGNGINIEKVKGQVITNNIITQSGTLTGYGHGCIVVPSNAYVYNNIIYDCYNGIRANYGNDDGWLEVYNNTIFNSGNYGIHLEEYDGSVTFTMRNNIVQESGTADYHLDFGDITYYDNNIASDATSPNDSFDNTTPSFVSTSTRDFHLLESDTSALDQGFDISASTTLFSTDIDGDSRPALDGWDIGADEYAQFVIYRSVGPGSTAALQCYNSGSANSMTFSGSTASFANSYGLLDNIGVGDAIVYNASSSIVFISGRTSSTTYSVQDADGTSPDTSASGDTGWCIFRAYTKLANAVDDTLGGTENTGIPAAVRDFDPASADKDIVSPNEQWNIACYADGEDYNDTLYNTQISDWTTSETNYLRIYTPYLENEVGTSQRHDGIWDDGKYYLKADANYGNAYGINISSVDNVRLEGLQILVDCEFCIGGGREGVGARLDVYSGDVYITNNIIRGINMEISAFGKGIRYIPYVASAGTEAFYAFNNIIYGFQGNSATPGDFSGISKEHRDASVNIFNNTIVDCDTGISRGGTDDDLVAYNNIVQGADTAYYQINSASDHNIANDSTTVGSNSINNATVKFWDEVGQDFHLHPEDTSGAIDGGTSSVADLIPSGEGCPEGGVCDIDNKPIHTYDIGADDASVYFESTVMETGGDFDSLYDWEATNNVDLTATTTMVFSVSSNIGYIPHGASLYGTSSGAVASTTLFATSTNQILLYNIASSTFINGEGVCVDGSTTNCVTLSDAGNYAIGTAKIDGVWSSVDLSPGSLTISGWETNKYNGIRIYTTPVARHQGKWNTNKYILHSNLGHHPINSEENNVHVEGLQIYQGRNDQGYAFISDNAVNISLISNIFSINTNNTVPDGGITFSTPLGSGDRYIINNIIYGYADTYGIRCRSSATSHCYIVNNTSYGNGYGIGDEDGYVSVVNNIAYNNATSDFVDDNMYADSDYNISSDSTAPGPNSSTSTTVSFVDAANNDFHLAATDTSAKDAGTRVWIPAYAGMTEGNEGVMVDIDGTTRGAVPDIGADEVNTEFVSTICETSGSGGDCSELDYNTLSQWEDAVESDLTPAGTRVFGGYLTGTLNENSAVTLVYPNYATTTVTGTVVATTSDQILIDNITGTSTPLGTASGTTWYLSAGNYWNIGGTGDELGASPIAIAKIDGSWNASDTTYVELDGLVSDHDNYIKIYTTDTARHNGVWDYNGYRLVHEYGLLLYPEHIQIDGLQIKAECSGDCWPTPFMSYADSYDSDIHVTNNIIAAEILSCTNYGTGISSSFGNISNFKIVNNIIYGFTTPNGNSRAINTSNMNESFFYNNTIYNSDTGINSATSIAINNIVASTTNPYNGTFAYGTDYNYTDHTSDDPGQGDNNQAGVTFSFVDENVILPDLHLASESAVGVDDGFDITSSSTLNVISGITTDIDGNSRPALSGWDVGADEYALYTIYRSVGPGSTAPLDCSDGTRSATISNSQITISNGAGLPDIVGVGDAIVYNASSSIVFISGRTSSTTYTVKDADGTSPDTSASADTGWCVFRAYTSLDNAESGTTNTGIPVSFDTWSGGRDLTTNNEQWNIACYADAVDSDTNNPVEIIGWTTGVSNYLKIYTPYKSTEVGASQRHSGKWNTDAYILSISDYFRSLNIEVSNVTIDGLQIETVRSGDHRQRAIELDTDISNIKISNNILKESGSTTYTGEAIAGFYGMNNNLSYYFYNNFIIGFNDGILCGSVTTGSNLRIYNNTIIGARNRGIVIGEYTSGTSFDLRNNLVIDSGSNDYVIYNGDTTYYQNNLSSDATAPGTDYVRNASVKFWDEVGEDFHLHPEDTSGAIDGGTSSVSSIVTSDIDGKPIHTYDIGADDASVYFESTVMESGGDFSSLYDWEAANNVDLTATTTMVFDVSASIGYIPHGASVYGTSSGAIASTTLFATSTNQILLYNIASSTFESGEGVCVLGGTTNCVTLSDAGNYAIGTAKIDGVWSSADSPTSEVLLSGWGTGKYNHIYIYTTPTARHQGKWDNTKYRLARNGDVISMAESYYIIDGLQVDIAPTSADTYREGIMHSFSNRFLVKNVTIKNNIVRQSNIATNCTGIGVTAYQDGSGEDQIVNFINNIVYDFSGDSSVCFYATEDSNNNGIAYYVHNTAYNCYDGIYGQSGSPTTLNNITQNCGNLCFTGSTVDGDYNISSDNTAPGANSSTSTTVSFVDATNHDFHLSTSDTVAKDAGTPTAYSLTPNAYVDIDGTTRGAVPDIGADEVNTEFVSTICETSGSGGDCSELDYNTLSQWEDAVESDLTPAGTRVFGGYLTGTLNENSAVTLVYPNYATTTVTGTVVATTSDQILIDNITGTSTPLGTASGSTWYLSAGNYWNIGGTGDELGASPIAIAKIDGSWNASDTTSVDLNGWTTDYDNYIKIYTTDTARHAGKWSYDKYRLAVTEKWDEGIEIFDNIDTLKIEGLQIANMYNDIDNGAPMGVFVNVNSAIEFHLSNSIVRGYGNNTTYGIGAPGSIAGSKYYLKNNVIYGFADEAIYFQTGSAVAWSAYLFNNTVYTPDAGASGIVITRPDKEFVLVNNLVQGPGENYLLWQIGSNCSTFYSNNIAQDTTSPNDTYDSLSVNFVASSSGDFHLLQTDTAAIDQGLDVTGTTTISISDDIDGNARPALDGWDVGADEYALYTIYRSVGPGSTGALECGGGSRQLTISSSQLTIDTGAGLADNIGVGDAIVYNASSSIVFISGRTSSTTYTVQDADGTSPDTAATADTGWCVYRAYTSLSNAEAGTTNTAIPVSFDTWSNGRDLVSNNEVWNIACYGDAEDDTYVEINGWTTNSSNYLKIYTPYKINEVGESQRHNGKWDTSKYNISNDGDQVVININMAGGLLIEGLQVNYKGSWTWGSGIRAGASLSIPTYVGNNIVRTTGSENYIGIQLNGTGEKYIYNNIVYDFTKTDGRGIYCDGDDDSCFIFNNTVYNCYLGLYSGYEDATVANNIVQKSINQDYHNTTYQSASANNISSDSTAPGTNSLTSIYVRFWDEVDQDFHLHPEEANAIDAGTSTVASWIPASAGMTEGMEDIDGKPIHTYDIGADDASVYFESTVMESGGDFSSLYDWEAANNVDLTAATTMVFDVSASIGYIPHGASVYGTSSGAVASTTLFATSTNQILLYNIASSTFEEGEGVCVSGGTTNCVTLSDAGNYAIGTAKIDGTWTTAEGYLYINGWETSEYNNVYIYTTPVARHQGVWDSSKFRISYSSSGFRLYESYTKVEGIQLEITGSAAGLDGISIEDDVYENKNGNNHIIIKDNIIKSDATSQGGSTGIVGAMYDEIMNYDIFNNIIYGFYNEAIYFDAAPGSIINIWNNTLVKNTDIGIREGATHFNMRNNIILKSNTDFYSISNTASSSNNISSDNTAPGINSITNAIVKFLDEANEDFRLATEDTTARDAGLDLSATTTLNFTTDIEGETRFGIWDIGADEGTNVLYRSVGNDTRDLAPAGTTVTIADSLATFSAPLPDNVGVGDVVQYGGAGYYTLAFIMGRASSTEYTVQNRLGERVSATTTATASVFRAHETLNDWEVQVVNEVNTGLDDSIDELTLMATTSLIASNTAMFVPCYASSSPDSSFMNIYGWNTATSNYIKVYTPVASNEVGNSQRFNGKWDNSKFVISTIFHTYLNENYIRIEGLQREVIGQDTITLGFAQNDFALNAGPSDIRISHSYIKLIDPGTANNVGLYIGNSSPKITVWNTIITGLETGISINDDAEVYIYNSVVYDNELRGIAQFAGSPDINIYNTAVFKTRQGGGYNFSGTISVIDHCASDDAAGTNAVDLASSTVVWNATFTDYANGDFTLKDQNSVLYNAGTTITIVEDDIIGTPRPFEGVYDIGAFESMSKPKFKFHGGGQMKIEGKVKIE